MRSSKMMQERSYHNLQATVASFNAEIARRAKDAFDKITADYPMGGWASRFQILFYAMYCTQCEHKCGEMHYPIIAIKIPSTETRDEIRVEVKIFLDGSIRFECFNDAGSVSLAVGITIGNEDTWHFSGIIAESERDLLVYFAQDLEHLAKTYKSELDRVSPETPMAPVRPVARPIAEGNLQPTRLF
jgi:hypothetical protein